MRVLMGSIERIGWNSSWSFGGSEPSFNCLSKRLERSLVDLMM